MTDAGPRILLVDDDALDREAVRRALRSIDPQPTVVEASGMREALGLIAGTSFDCVVLDYLLPEGPCLEFLHRLRTDAPHTAFIVLTGQGDEGIAVELMKAGASDYLSKDGLDPARLRAALKHTLALREAKQRAAGAEAQRGEYADQLRRFVERTPELVGARSLDQLTEAAAALAVDVLSAREAFVLLRHGTTEYVAQRGPTDATPSLAAWAREMHDRQPSELAREDGDYAALALRSRDGEPRGIIALRFAPDSVQARKYVFGQLAPLISVCSDNLVLYDAAARAIRARDDVMAVVSHDLRNPLNNVRLGVNLLREAIPESGQTVLGRVERNVTHMGRLVDDLVDMVRLEGGKLELTMRVERASNLLESASQLIADQARAAGIKLVVTPTGRTLGVLADRDRVLQVLSNLLGNALKFTSRDGEVSLRAVADGESVRFEVRDTGRGIPSEEGDKVFSRFWRSDPKKRQGLGLGLYIAKGLIQAHGGRLWYESQEGAGTTFFFTLTKSAANAVRARTPNLDGTRDTGPMQVMRRAAVIEDDDDTRALIASALERAGFAVADFCDAESFLAGENFDSFSIVVSDVGLPGRDGIEICSVLHEARSQVPVLLVTAFRDEAVFHRAQVVGCEVLTKPLNLGFLAQRAEQLARRP